MKETITLSASIKRPIPDVPFSSMDAGAFFTIEFEEGEIAGEPLDYAQKRLSECLSASQLVTHSHIETKPNPPAIGAKDVKGKWYNSFAEDQERMIDQIRSGTKPEDIVKQLEDRGFRIATVVRNKILCLK